MGEGKNTKEKESPRWRLHQNKIVINEKKTTETEIQKEKEERQGKRLPLKIKSSKSNLRFPASASVIYQVVTFFRCRRKK